MVLKESELHELNSFVLDEMVFSSTCAGIGGVTAFAIYIMSIMQLPVTSRMIYSLFRLFIVMCVVMIIGTIRYVYYALISARIVKGKMKVVMMRNRSFVKNYKRKNLKGKEYAVIKTLGFRYALRVHDVRES